MKFIRKKIIRDQEYYYLQFTLKTPHKRFTVSQYLGHILPPNLPERIQNLSLKAAQKTFGYADYHAKQYFATKSTLPLEESRFWYQSLHHELFESELQLFRSLFAILFTLNSNRAEGSKVTRKDIEKIIIRKRKPKTLLDREIINSFNVLRFAFSNEMKCNLKSIKKLHFLLFDHIFPDAGQFKKENNIIGNESTTPWQKTRKEMQTLLSWFKRHRKILYPPLVALEFHYRFEQIHPFLDGNGRIGRLLFNAYLLQQGYMPVIFFSENHESYCSAISRACIGRKKKLAHYLIQQVKKTRKAIDQYKRESIIRGGSPQVGRWEIEQGKIRTY